MRLTYTRTNDLAQLSDELLAAIPALRPTGDGERKSPVLTIQGKGDLILLDVPDATDPKAVAAVVKAHVPDPARAPEAMIAAAEQAKADDAADLATVAALEEPNQKADTATRLATLEAATAAVGRMLARRGMA